jgi:hypothetical protein
MLEIFKVISWSRGGHGPPKLDHSKKWAISVVLP